MSSEETTTETSGNEGNESQEIESESDTKAEVKTAEKPASSLDTYTIPKLSTSSSTTEDKNAQSTAEDDDVKVTVEEEQGSDAELLVDDTLEVQSEVNASDIKEDDKDIKDGSPNTKKENGTKEERSSRKRSRSRSRDRHRSRSRDRERRRRERHQDMRDTSSDHPDMIRSRVFVGHLDTDKVTKDDVHRLFAPYGRVIGVALHQGYGFVQYDNADSARAAIKEAHGTPVAGMKIVVDKTVKLKKMLGEDPHSEPPLPKDPPRRRSSDYDLDYYHRRDIHSRYSRLEELERRLLLDRYDRYPPPPPRRDPYYDSYYDRPPPPPSYLDSYDRPRYGDYERERDRFPPPRERERDRHLPPDPYYERRRDDFYDSYPPRADPYRHY